MKLLIEIGTQELPAIPFLKELRNIPANSKIPRVVTIKGLFLSFTLPKKACYL